MMWEREPSNKFPITSDSDSYRRTSGQDGHSGEELGENKEGLQQKGKENTAQKLSEMLQLSFERAHPYYFLDKRET